MSCIKSSDFSLGRLLGHGVFSNVFLGQLAPTGLFRRSQQVAVKCLRRQASQQEELQLRDEVFILSTLKHRNIIKVEGICIDTKPPMMVLEFMEGGSLLQYLQSPEMQQTITTRNLFKWVHDLCNACCFMEERGCVHRDLAARNCFISATGQIVKLGDFGLAKMLNSDGIFVSENVENDLMAIAWTAPEVFQVKTFSSKSDVWSFGVLLWEIFSWGARPFQPCRINHDCGRRRFSTQQIINFVSRERRSLLALPWPCFSSFFNGNTITSILAQCWTFDPGMRPRFHDIKHIWRSVKHEVIQLPVERPSSQLQNFEPVMELAEYREPNLEPIVEYGRPISPHYDPYATRIDMEEMPYSPYEAFLGSTNSTVSSYGNLNRIRLESISESEILDELELEDKAPASEPDIVRELTEVFKCKVCFGTAVRPVTCTLCRNLIGCRSCLRMWLQQSPGSLANQVTCPLCRGDWSFSGSRMELAGCQELSRKLRHIQKAAEPKLFIPEAVGQDERSVDHLPVNQYASCLRPQK